MGARNASYAPPGWESPPTATLRAGVKGPIDAIDTRAKPGFLGGKKQGAKLLDSRGDYLAELQEKLIANGRSGSDRSVLLVLQGMDTSGKGGIGRHVGGRVDPQGLKITGFGKPTEEELEHDFLWRIRKAVPPAGRIGIFDRSHYEDVLPVRVHNLVPQQEWEQRYDLINDFERELVDNGTVIVKCVLAISRGEQTERLAKRLNRPDKYWKYDPSDIAERFHWDEYMEAYQAVLDRCDSPQAPWYVIPADRKWFTRLAVCELLIAALEGLGLDWPEADFDVEEEKARLAALV